MSKLQRVSWCGLQTEGQGSEQLNWENKSVVQGKMAKLFKGQRLWRIENLGLCFPLEHSDKVRDKSPHWSWLSVMPFDAPDMFVKPKIRLCIEVIIFQFFVWKITELKVFFNNTVTDLPA